MGACSALLSLLQRDVMDTAVSQYILVCCKFCFTVTYVHAGHFLRSTGYEIAQ